VLFLTYFLLAAGDSFRRKIVTIAGPRLASRRITVQALDQINAQIQRYLLVQVLLSVIVGVATALAFIAVDMEHAGVWGVLAFALNFIPYIGSVVITAAAALAAFVQFGSIDQALVVAMISLVIHTISGHLLAPWLTSRTNQMNPVAVFVGVLTFGWLWGVWGLLLGVPLLLMVKSVCDHVEGLQPIGELLGR
jgi:predicted PurR-regulated permease PerM